MATKARVVNTINHTASYWESATRKGHTWHIIQCSCGWESALCFNKLQAEDRWKEHTSASLPVPYGEFPPGY